MKLAYTVGTPDTKGKMLAYRGEPEEVFGKLKNIGYSAIELFVRDPRDMDMIGYSRIVERFGFEVAAIGAGPVAAEDKLTFTASDESARNAAIERAKALVDFASIFGAPINTSKMRGKINPENQVQSREWMKKAFDIVCRYAESLNVKIMIEPQNRQVINNMNSTRQVLDWINESGIPNLYMMLDTFHLNIEDRSIAASIIEAKDRNIHFHISENNRGIPGEGHITFHEIIRVLKALGYNRYLSLEIDQLPDSYQAAKRSYEYLSSIINQI